MFSDEADYSTTISDFYDAVSDLLDDDYDGVTELYIVASSYRMCLFTLALSVFYDVIE